MTLTAALGLLAMGGVAPRSTTYDGAMILVALGSLVAVGAIVSLEVFSPVTRDEVSLDTRLQQAQ
jgi:hypothetical protein